MRLCFLFFGPQEEKIAQVMIASARQFMPNIVLTQLTDMTTKRVKGVDECRRLDGMTYGYLLAHHMSQCPHPLIRVDYDMVFQGDITHVMDGDYFDMAFNLHGDPNVISTEFGRKYPLATCLWGAKDNRFATDFRAHHIKSGRDDWLGLVPSANEVAERYRIKTLDGAVYNYCPKDRDDKPASALVIHYKGPRKEWMLPEGEAHLARNDVRRLGKRILEYAPRDEELRVER